MMVQICHGGRASALEAKLHLFVQIILVMPNLKLLGSYAKGRQTAAVIVRIPM